MPVSGMPIKTTRDFPSIHPYLTIKGCQGPPYPYYGRSYSSFGLFGMVLVVIIGNCLGIILGVLGGSSGNQPHERGCSSNSAGCLLMVSAGVVLSMSTIFMLLTTLTFVLGAPLEMIVCNNLRDLEKLKELENVYSGEGNYELGKLIHDDVSVALTISGLLRDCKDNKPIFEAVQLERRFDIDDLLNYSKYFDIKTELDKINVDLSTVNVFSGDLKTQLDAFRDALNVNFNAFYAQTSTLTPADDLDNSVTELQNYADTVKNIPLFTEHARLEAQIAAIKTIQTTDYVTVQKNTQTLNQSLVAMETSVSSVKPLIDTLETGLKDTDLYIQNNASGDISVFLGVYANRLLGVVDSYVARAESAVKTEIGRCEPVWNVYESIFIHTLCGGIVDAVNGFWFSLGWCVFFFLPSLVFSVKLAKYFKRMEPPASESYNQPAPQRQMSLADQWLKRNKVYHRDNEKDW